MVRYHFTPDRHFPRTAESGPDGDAIEEAFLQVVRAILSELAIVSVRVAGLEVRRDCSVEYIEGQLLGLHQLDPLLRHLVREECWGSLEAADFSVRVGYGYHLVVITPCKCPESEGVARSVALCVDKLQDGGNRSRTTRRMPPFGR
jgi:hypothetical protein